MGSEENRSSAIKTSQFYDTRWTTRTKEPTGDERKRLRAVQLALEKIIRRSNLRILDLGCGRGWMAPFLCRWGIVIGIDFSEAGIEFAKRNYGNCGEFVVADPTDPRLGLSVGQSYDLVVCSEVIEHVPDAAGLLQDIRQFLRVGGWCILTTPNGRLWEVWAERSKGNFQPIENWLTPGELRTLFQSTGFKVLRHYGVAGTRCGSPTLLQRGRVARLFERLHLDILYGRLILPVALYQVVVARRRP